MLPNGADMSCPCQALNEVQIHEQTELFCGYKPVGFRNKFLLQQEDKPEPSLI